MHEERLDSGGPAGRQEDLGQHRGLLEGKEGRVVSVGVWRRQVRRATCGKGGGARWFPFAPPRTRTLKTSEYDDFADWSSSAFVRHMPEGGGRAAGDGGL